MLIHLLADTVPGVASEFEVMVNGVREIKGPAAAIVVLIIVLEILRRRTPTADLHEIEESRRAERALVEETRRMETTAREETMRRVIDAARASKPPPDGGDKPAPKSSP